MAGSSMAFAYHKVHHIKKIIVDWVSDDAAGTASGTTEHISGVLLKGVTDPSGTAAPSDDYDIVITDPEGVDVLGASADDLVDRDTANTECVYFDLATGSYPVVCDKLTISVSAAGNSKEGQLILYWKAV